MRFFLLSILAAVTLPVAANAQAGSNSAGPAHFIAGPAEPGDPYIWLEEVSSPRAMDWVKEHNAARAQAFESNSRFSILYREALAISASRDRIPTPISSRTNSQYGRLLCR